MDSVKQEIARNLQAYRKKRGMTQRELGERIGVRHNAVSSWESATNAIDPDQMIRICQALDISPADLFGRYIEREGPAFEELEWLKKYRSLDAHGQELVTLVMEKELSRLKQSEPEELPAAKTRIIPLFGTSAAAGPAEPDTGNPFEEYEVPADSRADFAVRITGDSMEPYLHDGEIALCVKRPSEIGEVCVMMVNGALLVKQYITDGYNIYLRSTNRKRKDCDYDIWSTGNETVRGYGTVIMPKIPLVQQ